MNRDLNSLKFRMYAISLHKIYLVSQSDVSTGKKYNYGAQPFRLDSIIMIVTKQNSY